MLLVFHIGVALSGILASTIAALYPSKSKIRLSAGLIVATIASGSYLVWTTRTNILQTCISGLIYIGFTSSILILANWRLAAAEKIDLQD